MAFNINAQLILDGPKNLDKVKSKIKTGLSSITVPVKLQADKNTLGQARKLNSAVKELQRNMSALAGATTSANAALKTFSKSVSSVTNKKTGLTQASSRVNRSLNQTTKQTKQAANAFEQLGKQAATTLKQFSSFIIISKGLFGFINAVNTATAEAIEFERELLKISQITGQSVRGLAGLTGTIDNLSRGLGVASAELVGVARTLAQTGLTAKEVEVALSGIARASLTPTFDSMQQSTEGLIATFRQFNIQAADTEAVFGAINAVAKNFAVESDDIVAAIRRAGGVFAAAAGGIDKPTQSLNELIAIFTTVRSTTRETAETIAVGLRTIFTRLQRRGTIEFLKQFGIELTDNEGKFVGIFNAVDQLSAKLGDLARSGDAVTLSAITEELGGVRQVGKLIPLLINFQDVGKRAFAAAQDGATGFQEDVDIALSGLGRSMDRVRENFNALVRDFLASDTFQSSARSLLTLADSFISLTDALTPLLPTLATLASVKIGQASAQFFRGFAGSFGGGGATPAVAAGGAGGSSGLRTQQLQSQLNTHLSQNTTATTANTQALSHLSRQILGSFGGRARGPARGPRGFASGGLVPGSGSGDTVPAMLEPGEFVLRKQSVNAIGTSNLSGLNRFALGGRVGGIALNPLGSVLASSGTVKVADVIDALSKNTNLPKGIAGNKAFLQSKKRDGPGGETFKKLAANIVSEIAFSGGGQQTFTSYGAAFPDTKSGESAIEEDIKNSLRSAFKNIIAPTGRRLASLTGAKVLRSPNNNIINQIGVEDSAGKIFEGAIAVLGGDPFDELKASSTELAPFDFPKGIGSNLANSFKEFGPLGDIPVDAKKTLTGNLLKDIATNKTKNALAAQVNTSPKFAALKRKEQQSKGGARVAKKALGGNVDSVPALLTPGEFVINKQSASAIGRGNLNQLNRLNKGGVVRRFATGTPGGGRPSTISPAGLAALGGSPPPPPPPPKEFSGAIFGAVFALQQLSFTLTNADASLGDLAFQLPNIAFALSGLRELGGVIGKLNSNTLSTIGTKAAENPGITALAFAGAGLILGKVIEQSILSGFEKGTSLFATEGFKGASAGRVGRAKGFSGAAVGAGVGAGAGFAAGTLGGTAALAGVGITLPPVAIAALAAIVVGGIAGVVSGTSGAQEQTKFLEAEAATASLEDLSKTLEEFRKSIEALSAANIDTIGKKLEESILKVNASFTASAGIETNLQEIDRIRNNLNRSGPGIPGDPGRDIERQFKKITEKLRTTAADFSKAAAEIEAGLEFNIESIVDLASIQDNQDVWNKLVKENISIFELSEADFASLGLDPSTGQKLRDALITSVQGEIADAIDDIDKLDLGPQREKLQRILSDEFTEIGLDPDSFDPREAANEFREKAANVSGDDTAARAARERFGEIADEFDRLANDVENSAKSAAAMALIMKDLNDRIENSISAIDSLASSFEFLNKSNSIALDNTERRISVASGDTRSLVDSGNRVNPFENIKGAGEGNLTAALDRIRATLGTSELAGIDNNSIATISGLSNVSDTLTQLVNTTGISNTGNAREFLEDDAVLAAITESVGGNEAAAKAIFAKVENVVNAGGGRQSEGGGDGGGVLTVKGLLDTLANHNFTSVEALTANLSRMDDEVTAFAKNTERMVNIMVNQNIEYIQSMNGLTSNLLQQQNLISQAAGRGTRNSAEDSVSASLSRLNTSGLTIRGVRAPTNNVLDGAFGAGGDSGSLNIAELTRRRNAALERQQTITNTGGDAGEAAVFASEANRLTSVLQLLRDDTSRLTDVNKKLADLSADQQRAQQGLTSAFAAVVSGDAEGLLQTVLPDLAAGAFVNSGGATFGGAAGDAQLLALANNPDAVGSAVRSRGGDDDDVLNFQNRRTSAMIDRFGGAAGGFFDNALTTSAQDRLVDDANNLAAQAFEAGAALLNTGLTAANEGTKAMADTLDDTRLAMHTLTTALNNINIPEIINLSHTVNFNLNDGGALDRISNIAGVEAINAIKAKLNEIQDQFNRSGASEP